MISLRCRGLPWWLSGQKIYLQSRRLRFDPWVKKNPWRRKWQPTPVFLLGKAHGQRSLAGYSPWGCKESDTSEHEHRQAYRGNIFTNICDNVLFPTHHFLAVWPYLFCLTFLEITFAVLWWRSMYKVITMHSFPVVNAK